jgi:hypothetical protein
MKECRRVECSDMVNAVPGALLSKSNSGTKRVIPCIIIPLSVMWHTLTPIVYLAECRHAIGMPTLVSTWLGRLITIPSKLPPPYMTTDDYSQFNIHYHR